MATLTKKFMRLFLIARATQPVSPCPNDWHTTSNTAVMASDRSWFTGTAADGGVPPWLLMV